MKYKGTVFLYNITGARARQIGMLCARLGLLVKAVEPDRYGVKLGILAGIPGFEAEAGQPKFEAEMSTGAGQPESAAEANTDACPPRFEDEMLVMKDFDQQTLDQFLRGFRSMKIPPVALKAVLTPTNCGWTSAELHEAIKEEHETILRQKQAQQAERR